MANTTICTRKHSRHTTWLRWTGNEAEELPHLILGSVDFLMDQITFSDTF